MHYILYNNYIRLAAKIIEKHTSHEIQHRYTNKCTELQNRQYQCVPA